MKKILLTTLITALSFTLFAQISPINIGVHGGFINTKIDTKSLGEYKDIKESAKGGFMIGAFARINLGKLYLQPELNYTSKKSEIKIPEIDQTLDLKYNTIDIPILLGYKIVKLPMLKVRVFAGPVASFSVNALDVNWGGIETPKPDIDPKKAIWNVKVGAGIDLWKLSLDLDYEKGLTDFKSGDIKAPSIFNVTIGLRII